MYIDAYCGIPVNCGNPSDNKLKIDSYDNKYTTYYYQKEFIASEREVKIFKHVIPSCE